MSNTPPQDHAAEQAVLGAMLNGARRHVVDDLSDVLVADDFYRPAHGTIFDACIAVAREHDRVDPVLVARQLGPQETERVGGAPYLHTLMSAPVTVGNALHHAGVVQEKATARRLVEAGMRIQQLGSTHTTPSEAVEDARGWLDELSQRSTQTREAGALLGDVLADAIDQLDNPVAGMPTPWPDIDRVTHGMHPGQLIVIGARPAVGKSVLAANLAAHAARNGVGTYFATLEMAKHEVVNRLLAQRCRVNLSSLIQHRLSEREWESVSARVGELHEWPLVIDDDAGLSLHQIRARARSAARKVDLGLVIVDYLQLVRPRDQRIPREQQVAEMSRGLKELGKELGVPVVALAQLNRNAHDEPTMRDLRESGQIEADADQIWLLHRPDLYNAEDCPGQLFVHVAKNRQGPQTNATLAFHGHYSEAASYQRV